MRVGDREVFASAEEFLARPREVAPGCLVLDVSLPDLNGLELQKRIADRPDLPIIFITGHGDIPMTVQAMKAGAVEFLTKPFGPEVLLSAIQGAIERSRASLAQEADLQVLRDRYESLTRRERQVMALVVRGQLNKQVAGELSTQRDHREGAPRAGDAEDGGTLLRGAREHGSAPGPCGRG